MSIIVDAQNEQVQVHPDARKSGRKEVVISTVFLSQEHYQGALDVLLLAEEAFGMCSPAHLERVDNVGLLMIDIAW